MFLVWGGVSGDKASIAYFIIHVLSQTAMMTICFLAAFSNIKYAELYGPVLVCTALLVMEICNHTQSIEMPERKHVQDLGIYMLVYLIYVGLLTTTFWAHFFPRMLWYLVCCAAITRTGVSHVGVTILFFL